MKKSLLEELHSTNAAIREESARNKLLVESGKDTPHMVLLEALTDKSPVGKKGERIWAFLSDSAYEGAKRAERGGDLKILHHNEAKREEPNHRAKKHEYSI